jgi:hypothetical protein
LSAAPRASVAPLLKPGDGRADGDLERPRHVPSETHSVDLSFQPCLESVSAVRKFLEVHYGRLKCNAELISRMAVTVHELLENAAKYSAGGGSRLRVDVDPRTPHALSVSVANVVDPRHLPGLQETVAELSAATDPFDVYQRYLLRAATRDEGSGLGLARVFVEANMDVKLELSDDHICVKAVATPPTEGTS